MSKENILTEQLVNDLLFRKPYVAFLDILGFKSLVLNNKHEILIDLYQLLMNFQVDFCETHYNYENIKIIIVSDSIILWTENSQEKTLIQLLEVVKFLLLHSISIGIPLRGSIVKDNISALERNGTLSLVGLGLVRAYENENIQNWSGCSVEEQIIKTIENHNKVLLGNKTSHVKTLNSLIVKTKIPIKIKNKEKNVLGYAVNWADNSELGENIIRESFSKFNKRVNETDKLKECIDEKIDNTLIFYREFGGKK